MEFDFWILASRVYRKNNLLSPSCHLRNDVYFLFYVRRSSGTGPTRKGGITTNRYLRGARGPKIPGGEHPKGSG